MIEEVQINQLNLAFKRIFAMPISRSTFREIQNAILSSSIKSQEESNLLFESLVTGESQSAAKVCTNETALLNLIDNFSISIRVAKDVYERGEFISLASSDIISQPNRVAFLNRVRRVDGEEMHFLTDVRGTINLVHHLTSRLQELQKNEAGKNQLDASKPELKEVKKILDSLTV